MDTENGSGVGDILSSFFDAAQTGYTDYQLASAGIIPTNTPGQYAIQPGSRGQIIQPSASSNQMTILMVVILLIVSVFAFKAIK